MPKGHALPNMMDNEVVHDLYYAAKVGFKTIDFGELAAHYGTTKGAARQRLATIMKAQEKGLDTTPASASTSTVRSTKVAAAAASADAPITPTPATKATRKRKSKVAAEEGEEMNKKVKVEEGTDEAEAEADVETEKVQNGQAAAEE